MANRKRKQRAFTLPDDFVNRLSEMARHRNTTMSQLIQEYGEQCLRTEEFAIKLHKDDTFGYLRIDQVLSDQRLLDICRAIVFARDAEDQRDAYEQLHDWLEWNDQYISVPQDEES